MNTLPKYAGISDREIPVPVEDSADSEREAARPAGQGALSGHPQRGAERGPGRLAQGGHSLRAGEGLAAVPSRLPGPPALGGHPAPCSSGIKAAGQELIIDVVFLT